MARPRKPLAELKKTGQYRKDRHGSRVDLRLTDRQPAMPRWLTDRVAKDLWNKLAPPLYRAKLAALEDSHALAALCDWWAKYRAAGRAQARADTIEKQRLAALTASTCWRNCADLMRRFGLTPGDRANLKIEGGQDEPTEVELRYFGAGG